MAVVDRTALVWHICLVQFMILPVRQVLRHRRVLRLIVAVEQIQAVKQRQSVFQNADVSEVTMMRGEGLVHLQAVELCKCISDFICGDIAFDGDAIWCF